MMPNTWKQWEGQIVNAEFPLLRYIGGSDHSAVFLTEFHEGERQVSAAIKLIPAVGQTDELQLSHWRLAGDLSHPHLISLMDGGRCELGGMPLLYVVMECAEENLSQVLPSRALTPDEAREMLTSVLDVLGYLHGKGFVHGHIKPVNIMADGDQLKLSSDALCRAGEALERSVRPDVYDPPEKSSEANEVAEPMSPAFDVWSLGMTLVEVMTQKLPVAPSAGQREPTLLERLPEPFFDIARHCLARRPQDRWSVAQISARLQGRAPVPSPILPLTQAYTEMPRTEVQAPPQPQAGIPRSVVTKRGNYGIPIAAAIVLALAAILGVPRLLRNHSDITVAPAPALEQPPVPDASKQITQAQREPAVKASRPEEIGGQQESKRPNPIDTSVHPAPVREEPTNTGETLPAGDLVRGGVAQQVLPEVLESARNTIRGTVKVSVKVDVDQSGNVENAELESGGPSKYFAHAALQAAQHWKFNAPKVAGRGVLSGWTLKFEFTRGGTTVIPKQEIP